MSVEEANQTASSSTTSNHASSQLGKVQDLVSMHNRDEILF